MHLLVPANVTRFGHLGLRRKAFIIQSGTKTNCSGERASSMLHATLDNWGISFLPVSACDDENKKSRYAR